MMEPLKHDFGFPSIVVGNAFTINGTVGKATGWTGTRIIHDLYNLSGR